MLKIMSKIRHENIVKEMEDKHKQELDRKDYEYKKHDKSLRNRITHLKQMLESSEEVNREKNKTIKDETTKRIELEEKLKEEKISSDNKSKQLKEKDEEIETLVNIVKRLKGHIEKNHDKEINRFEVIARRTKKARIREKCESKILDYKEKKLEAEKDE